jgi:hypothetical protein
VTARYVCRDEGRRAVVSEAIQNGAPVNGIDFVEVSADQLTLFVHFLSEPLPTGLSQAWVRIEGGERIRNPRVVDARVSGKVLAVRVEQPGDFSLYTLRLIEPAPVPPHQAPASEEPTDEEEKILLDPHLSEVRFSFKVDCPTDFDCRTDRVCPLDELPEPELSYLAKDYASFRRLMLDRLSQIALQWQERNPADLGIALVELLAYAGDQLSYYQDAVGTESYLGTARKRVSVRRHARLVDYTMHEGANARTFVVFAVDVAADGAVLPGPDPEHNRPGTMLLTRIGGEGPVLTPERLPEALAAGVTVFETMHDVTLREAHNQMLFYTWSDKECCLPAGATAATLEGPLDDLAKDELLLFEEVKGPHTGQDADADPRHRHVVRLTRVVKTDGGEPPEPLEDPVTHQQIVEIEWDATDALPFPLCLSSITDAEHKSEHVEAVSVARGNVALADHGRTVSEDLGAVVADAPFRPVLDQGPPTFAAPLPAGFGKRPAAVLRAGSPREARPALYLRSGTLEDEVWRPQPDLLASDRFSRELVVEMEEDGRAHLRFGDDRLGRAPDAGSRFTAWYRAGNGPSGNVGAEALRQVFSETPLSGILAVRNPLPATGGREPESLEEVRQFAPQAFRVQQRAVTADDWADVAERHAEVQRAAATFRWTGSWYTVFLTVDRKGGRPVDAAFERDLRQHLGFFRLAGYDLEVEPPRLVALDVALRVCVRRGYLRGPVKAELLSRLGTSLLPGGRRGLFHPDDWTFGQPVYLSRLYAAATEVEGVDSVEVVRFQRWGRPPRGEMETGVLPLGRLEIARLDNDPSFQENGRLELLMGGGR